MKKILLDTNFLILPGQKIDIYELLEGKELVTLDLCMKELQRLAEGKKKDAGAAKIALLLAKNRVKVVKSCAKSADLGIISEAKKHKYLVVATNDRKLIKTLKKHGIRILRLRQGRMITEE